MSGGDDIVRQATSAAMQANLDLPRSREGEDDATRCSAAHTDGASGPTETTVSIPKLFRHKMRLLRARKRWRDMRVEPEQAALRESTIRRVLAACYEPVPAVTLDGRRHFVGKSVTMVAAATVPAMALSPGALAALAPASVLPKAVVSDVAGQHPGDGTLPRLHALEHFFNLADGTFAWVDASGTQRRVDLGDLRTPAFYGAVGEQGVDDTAALRAFFSGGQGYLKPAPGGYYSTSETLSVPAGSDFFGPQSAIIKLVRPAGTPAVPLMDTARWSSGGAHVNLLGGFTLDHNAALLASPSGGASWVAVGSAMILRSGYSNVQITVKNSWDNGIFVSDYDWKTNTYSADPAPPAITIHDGYSVNCGCGNHDSLRLPMSGRNGGGVDVGNARGFLISGWYDHGSSSAVGTDTAGASFGQIVNCFSVGTVVDKSFPSNGSGNSFVVQTNGVVMSACVSFFAGRSGFWITGTSASDKVLERSGDATCISSCFTFFSGMNGFWINAPRISLASCNAYAPSRSAKGIYDGFRVECTFEDIYNVTVSGCSATTLTTSDGLADGFMHKEYNESAQFIGQYPSRGSGYPFGDGKPYAVSATIIGGFNLSKIATLGRSTYFLEAGMYSPSIDTGLLTSKGGLALWGGPSPKMQPVVTGAKASNEALASLITALASYGLIRDNTV